MSLTDEICAAAARLVVDEGMEYGPAKRKAARVLGRHAARSAEMPGNEQLEEEVRQHIALFHADTQPVELAALRAVARDWMQRMQAFRPHLSGAVWRGTATRHNDVHLQLYCDDSKEAEIALINLGVDYEVGETAGPRGETVAVLAVSVASRHLGVPVTVQMTVLDHDDVRGALKPDSQGRSWRGDLAALDRLTEAA